MAGEARTGAPIVDAKEGGKPGIDDKLDIRPDKTAKDTANKLTIITNTEGPTSAIIALAEGTVTSQESLAAETPPTESTQNNAETVGELANNVAEDPDYDKCLQVRKEALGYGGYPLKLEIDALRDFESKHPEKARLYRQRYQEETDGARNEFGAPDPNEDLYFRELAYQVGEKTDEKLRAIKEQLATEGKTPEEQLNAMADAYWQTHYETERDVYATYKETFPKKVSFYRSDILNAQPLDRDIKAGESLDMMDILSSEQRKFWATLSKFSLVEKFGEELGVSRDILPSEAEILKLQHEAGIPDNQEVDLLGDEWFPKEQTQESTSVQPTGREGAQGKRSDSLINIIRTLLATIKR